jgi:hypothetical protein
MTESLALLWLCAIFGALWIIAHNEEGDGNE